MKNQNLFVSDVRGREETVTYGGLGVAGLVMVLVAISSMANFASGLDRIGNVTVVKSPVGGAAVYAVSPATNRPCVTSVGTIPGPAASTVSHRRLPTPGRSTGGAVLNF